MCDFDEACIRRRLETYYRALETEVGSDFDDLEAEIDRRMNAEGFNGRRDYRPDGVIDASEVDYVVQRSGAASPGLFYPAIRGRIWETLDQNRDGRVTRDEMRRVAERGRGR